MRSVGIEEARRTIGDLVDRARLTGEPTMITRHGKPGAVLVAVEWFTAAQTTTGPADGPVTAQDGGDQA